MAHEFLPTMEERGFTLIDGKWMLPPGVVPLPSPSGFAARRHTERPFWIKEGKAELARITAANVFLKRKESMPFQFQLGLPSQQPQTGQLPPLSTSPGGLSTILLEVGRQLAKKFIGGPPAALGAHSGSQAGEPVGDVFGFPDVIEGMIKGTLPRGARQIQMDPNGLPECPQGFHFHKGHGRWCVHNRRMNSLNPRALSRASRRIGGFARAVKRARTIKRVCKSL